MSNLEYALVDLEGATLDRAENEAEAHDKLRQMVRDDPKAADEVLIFTYEYGVPLGDTVMYEDLP